MICGFCGHEFAEHDGIRGCGACGLPGKCHMVRCPKCNYENPLEPAIVKKLKNIINKGGQQ
jgi:predicted amidophosphoribosyltransferase